MNFGKKTMIEFGKNFAIKDLNLPENALPFKMLWVEPGEFTMGLDNYAAQYAYNSLDVENSFDVIITKGFWLGETLVTQAHWNSFMKSPLKVKNIIKDVIRANKWMTEEEIYLYERNPNVPIPWAKWDEAILFCRELNIRYKNQIPHGYHFSLPTEAQWEYVCRTGISNGPYFDECAVRTALYPLSEVKKTYPNDWGFYDLLENLSEFCFDLAGGYPCKLLMKDENFIKVHPLRDGKFIDWIANTDYLYEVLPEPARVVRGLSIVFREYQMFYGTGPLNGPWGFRVALRPITKSDLNDPELKELGINILGDNKA